MKLLRATRPAFLSITLVAVALGIAFAWAKGAALDGWVLVLTLLGALFAHAGANVINDVHDALNGSDACNTERVAPFTGGSRFIQEGTIGLATMRQLARTLLGVSMITGLVLVGLTDGRLVIFGLLGLLLAVAYSAPPLALMNRGLGEVAVGAAWALVVLGSDFVLRRSLDSDAAWPAVVLAGQVMLILIVNQVPDFAADATVGKRNWVVRLGRARAALIYRAVLAASHIAIVLAVLSGQLPASALLALLLLIPGLLAGADVARHAESPQQLRRAIVLTLLSAHLVGGGLIASLIADRLLKT